jgi:hypothetical protein
MDISSNNYTISMATKAFQEITTHSVIDKRYNSGIRKLSVPYINQFNMLISTKESLQIIIHATNGSVNPTPKKTGAKFFVISGECHICKRAGKTRVKYSISIDNPITNYEASYVNLDVNRLGTHDHTCRRSKSSEPTVPATTYLPNLKGALRTQLAIEIIAAGGVQMYYSEKNLKNQPVYNTEVLNRVLRDHRVKDNVADDWLKNLISVASGIEVGSNEKNHSGYVQKIVSFPYFCLVCYNMKQKRTS